ncbi:MAG: SoxR reducing system RseC family protein [Gallionella sp.]|nr:SoxR reducing system RseC family protein [Gallionella sp.]MDD4959837.1 SoxR reducing system RseC family protein [Gallionella sp.]
MIETSARVIATENGTAQVEPTLTSGCGGCQSRSSCGISGLGKYFSNHRKAIEVRCDSSIQAGDELQLSMTEGDLLKAGLLAYLLPSVLALVGAGIGAAWGDVGAVIGMIAGFLVGFLVAKLSRWTPRLVAKKA